MERVVTDYLSVSARSPWDRLAGAAADPLADPDSAERRARVEELAARVAAERPDLVAVAERHSALAPARFRLTARQAAEARALHAAGWSYRVLARRYGVSRGTVARAVLGGRRAGGAGR
jgi:DNA-directed RNA polymerase specialized sigma24 family protein